ncbi:hypothetical protein [Piscirickettsia salmonis]|uniref:hypothetical protein n=1 Tax=Piscirickettsia salmonis TaxID=1238 RepID=UPI0007C92C86|nr:hypothetical protein A0O36_02666 [Piscirickettsiaceae bacterium NZ-RLO1]
MIENIKECYFFIFFVISTFLLSLTGFFNAFSKSVPLNTISRDIFYESDMVMVNLNNDKNKQILNENGISHFLLIGLMSFNGKSIAVVKDKRSSKYYQLVVGDKFYGAKVIKVRKNKLSMKFNNKIIEINKKHN